MRSHPWPPMRPDGDIEDFKLEYEDSSEQAPVVQPAAAPAVPAANLTNTTNSTNDTVITAVAALKNEKASVATSIGIMLLGMVTFVMSLFYAVNFPDSDIQYATWLTLSEAMSLLMAVLLFTSFKDIMVLQFGETGGHHDGIPDTKSMILSFIRMLIAFWGVQSLLMKYRRTDLPLKAWGSIGGNFVAFAAIDSFGMVQQFPPFRDNPANAFLGAAIAGFMILCMCISAHIVRDYVMTYEDGIIKEHERNWNEQCKQVENQFAAICLGLLMSVVVRYSISGSLPAIWGSPKGKTQDQVNTLFGVSLGFAVPVFAMSLTVAALEGQRGSIPGIVRGAKVTQLILSMCMGWSLVFCGQWEFWSSTHGNGVGLGDKMTARMIDALIFSYLSFGFIISLDFLADKIKVARTGFNAVTNSFVLGLGIAWQGAFSEAVNALSHRFEDKSTRAYMDALMTMILCAIVLPAWLWYMLPKALAGPQPLEDKSKKKEGETGSEEEKPADEDGGGSGGEAQAAKAETEGQAKAEYCNTCGSQFEDGAEFCQNCGGKKSDKDEASPEPDASPPPTAPTSGGGKAGAGGKAAASGGKGGRGSTGKSSAATSQPASTWDDNSQWEQQDQSWEQHDDASWGQEGQGGGDASF